LYHFADCRLLYRLCSCLKINFLWKICKMFMICMLCHCNVVLLFIFMNKWLALLKGQLPCKKWLDLLKEQPPCKKNDWPFWKDSYHVNKWLALLKEQSTCEKMAWSIERTATMLKKIARSTERTATMWTNGWLYWKESFHYLQCKKFHFFILYIQN
jgi:hypothetical protein